MKRLAPFACLALLLALAPALAGCGERTPPSAHDHEGQAEEPPRGPTNRIAVPPAVRRNLGINFAPVERRHVASTVRVPGTFELLPEARREYHANLSGRVELLVEQYEAVEVGTPLYRVDSPAWHELQQRLIERVVAIRATREALAAVAQRVEAVEGHTESLREQEQVWAERVGQLTALIEAGSGAASALAEARGQLAAVRSDLAETAEERAELRERRAALEAEVERSREVSPLLHAYALGASPSADEVDGAVDLALARAAAMAGMSVERLLEPVERPGGSVPRWRTIDVIEVPSRQHGVVGTLAVTNGTWIEEGALVLITVDPDALRFRAAALQSDLGRIADGMPARIVPPRGGSDLEGAVAGSLRIALEAHAHDRKIDLVVTPEATLPTWARSGVAAEVEIVTDQTSEPRLAIPTGAVITDGLERVIFRRDPKDPDTVIRIEADLGVSDGRWVVVESGLTDGDSVVEDGIYELMLVSGGAQDDKGGHFHADGTFHAEDH